MGHRRGWGVSCVFGLGGGQQDESEETMSENLIGRENPYTCQDCGGITNTAHVDDGVTPFMLDCRATPGCKGWAHSAGYPKGPRPPHIPAPTWEWYRPDAKEAAKLSPGMADHVAQGGLLIRRHTPESPSGSQP
jgi:hypothetical protein